MTGLSDSLSASNVQKGFSRSPKVMTGNICASAFIGRNSLKRDGKQRAARAGNILTGRPAGKDDRVQPDVAFQHLHGTESVSSAAGCAGASSGRSSADAEEQNAYEKRSEQQQQCKPPRWNRTSSQTAAPNGI